MAVVDGEDWLNATACGPCRAAISAHGVRCRVQRFVPGDRYPAGIGIALRPRAA